MTKNNSEEVERLKKEHAEAVNRAKTSESCKWVACLHFQRKVHVATELLNLYQLMHRLMSRLMYVRDNLNVHSTSANSSVTFESSQQEAAGYQICYIKYCQYYSS